MKLYNSETHGHPGEAFFFNQNKWTPSNAGVRMETFYTLENTRLACPMWTMMGNEIHGHAIQKSRVVG